MRKSVAVIGEGITEKYFIESLRGFTPFELRPKTLGLRVSSLVTLEKHIKETIEEGFDEVYCLIDMDEKMEGTSKTQYVHLKNNYHGKIHGKKTRGIRCKVVFVETERCMELWFLYHFQYTTRKYNSYHELEKDLRKYWLQYEKTDKFFRSLKLGLYSEIITKGDLAKAIKYAEASLKSKTIDNRNYTFCEIHIFLKAIGVIN